MLSVSHIVLICNEREMKNDLKRTIKLASDSIMRVREMIDQQPKVFIIMNLLSDANETVHDETINGL